MSKFWQAGPRVKELLSDYNNNLTDGQKNDIMCRVEYLLGNRLNFMLHYKGGEVYLETAEEDTQGLPVILQNCELVENGQFFALIPENEV